MLDPTSLREFTDQELSLVDALADRAKAEARKAVAEAQGAESMAAIASIALEKETELRHRQKLADDFKYHRYLFDAAVSDSTIKNCIRTLNAWDREDPDCDIEIAFSSPGGDLFDGMELFDFITSLRREGRTITTSAYGMAASMAGILLQAGDVRVIGKQAYILIHEVSFGAGGKIGAIEDMTKFMRRVQGRILDIYADRCKDSDADHPFTRSRISKGWTKTDWWLDADEALAAGLVDVIR